MEIGKQLVTVFLVGFNMKKLIFLLFLIPSLVMASGVQDRHKQVIARKNACTQTYAFETTANADLSIGLGRYAGSDYTGFLYTPDSGDETICKVDVYFRAETGDPTGRDYYLEIYTVVAGDLAVKVATSSTYVDGADANGNCPAWASALTGIYQFSSPPTLSNGVLYAFVIFVTTDEDLTDDSETSETDYISWGIDNENDSAAKQGGLADWTWDDTIPYTAYASADAEDDFFIRISTQ